MSVFILRLGLLSTTILIFSACNKVDFRPLNPPSEEQSLVQAPRCTTQLVDTYKPTNVMFIVDQSGSNVNGPYGQPGRATDKNKVFRGGMIADFVSRHQAQTNLSWSFLVFNGTSARSLINDASSGLPVFSGSLPVFLDAFNAFKSSPDVGVTPYRAALSLASETIRRDRATRAKEIDYVLAFITDGNPTDFCPGGSTEMECPGRIMEDQIDLEVRKLVAAAPGRVQLGAVYYGPRDPDASARLSRMAKLAEGQFIDLNESSQVNLNDILQVTQKVCDDGSVSVEP